MRKFWQRPRRGAVSSYIRRMREHICNLINTRLQPRAAVAAADDRGRIVHVTPEAAGVIDPRYKVLAIRPRLLSSLFLLALCFSRAVSAVQPQDAEYEAVAEEYVKTYLAAHPLQGTALGFHEYDGKISDYSRLALDAELSRLRRFDDRLAKFDPAKLSARQSIDFRILQTAVKRELFEMQDMSVFERNPMVYARAADVNVYVKRNFAPLE